MDIKVREDLTIKEKIQAILWTSLVALMWIIILVLAYNSQIEKENKIKYTLNGYVINKQIIKTEQGHIWKYDTKYKKGSKVKVSFNDKDTDNIFDDEVLKVELR